MSKHFAITSNPVELTFNSLIIQEKFNIIKVIILRQIIKNIFLYFIKNI